MHAAPPYPSGHRRFRSTRGIILPTLLFICVLVLLAAGAFDLSLQSFKYSHRNDVRARARTVAESELEYIYFNFEDLLITGKAKVAEDIPELLKSICDTDLITQKPRKPFALMHRGLDKLDPDRAAPKDDWIVMRVITVSQSSIEGIIPDSNGKQGSFSYLNARITVAPGPSSPLYNKISLTFGRRFSYATASIFQYNVFSQGDLEFNPGGNTIIEGDIAANGSVYMGNTSGTLTVKGYVRYLKGDYFNATAKTDSTGALATPPPAGEDGVVDNSSLYFANGGDKTLTAITFRKPGTLIGNTLVTATDETVMWTDAGPLAVSSNGLIAPTFSMSQATQVTELKSPENLLGGLDAKSLAQNNNLLFGPTATNVNADDPVAVAAANAKLDAAMNNVYRSLIAPPPEAVYAATGFNKDTASAEYPSGTPLDSTPDNPEIAALRAYNRAGLVVTVTSSGGVPHLVVTGKDGTNFTPNLPGVLSSSTLTDLREGKNIPITQIDVGALGAAIKANPALSGFNGLLYVYLANSSATAPAAVRLVNAEKTPGYETSSGFSVATNGGLYVQGDYNTVTKEGTYALDATNTGTLNPTMLMADSITVLSKDWKDSNSSNVDITSRPANTTTTTPATVVDGVTQPAVTTTTRANLVINAGILTGNVSATDTRASGGGQNLVRYLENWNVDIDTVDPHDPGRTVRLNGSIGRLFDSRHYTTPFQQPAQFNPVTGKNEGTYRTPSLRTFAFNDTLKNQNTRPPGSPIITYFDRGNFFSSELN